MTLLTTPQLRELRKIVSAGDGGRGEGSGTNFRVRARLRQMGLVDLRPASWQGANGVHYNCARWFATDEGRSAMLGYAPTDGETSK